MGMNWLSVMLLLVWGSATADAEGPFAAETEPPAPTAPPAEFTGDVDPFAEPAKPDGAAAPPTEASATGGAVLDAAPPIVERPGPSPSRKREYEQLNPCDSRHPDPELCYREKGHLGAYFFGGIGGEGFDDKLGYGFGLRGGAQIFKTLEAGIVVARYMGSGTAYAVLPQLNLLVFDAEAPTANLYLGGQAGFLRRQFPSAYEGETVSIDGLAFGAQVGLAIHFPPSFALRFELAWLHADEASTHEGRYWYNASSADLAQLQVALCLTF